MNLIKDSRKAKKRKRIIIGGLKNRSDVFEWVDLRSGFVDLSGGNPLQLQIEFLIFFVVALFVRNHRLFIGPLQHVPRLEGPLALPFRLVVLEISLICCPVREYPFPRNYYFLLFIGSSLLSHYSNISIVTRANIH